MAILLALLLGVFLAFIVIGLSLTDYKEED